MNRTIQLKRGARVVAKNSYSDQFECATVVDILHEEGIVLLYFDMFGQIMECTEKDIHLIQCDSALKHHDELKMLAAVLIVEHFPDEMKVIINHLVSIKDQIKKIFIEHQLHEDDKEIMKTIIDSLEYMALQLNV